jgi:hypothetical protein
MRRPWLPSPLISFSPNIFKSSPFLHLLSARNGLNCYRQGCQNGTRITVSELERCYRHTRSLLGGAVEPLSVVRTAEAHRKYWRPKKVRVLLLAESHVYTTGEECSCMSGPREFGPAGVPRRFIRLVYCLGYGEPDYVGAELARNLGTPQYWKVFASCLYSVGTPAFRETLKTVTPGAPMRLKAKMALLARLKERGIWLLDASILALYKPGGGKPSARVRDQVIQICWDQHIGDIVSDASPLKIIVIGSGVERALSGRLWELTGGEYIRVYQPQGLRDPRAIQEACDTYHSVCAQYAPEP